MLANCSQKGRQPVWTLKYATANICMATYVWHWYQQYTCILCFKTAFSTAILPGAQSEKLQSGWMYCRSVNLIGDLAKGCAVSSEHLCAGHKRTEACPQQTSATVYPPGLVCLCCSELDSSIWDVKLLQSQQPISLSAGKSCTA